MNASPLLLSVGTSHAVAIQAYLLVESIVGEVHILGTDNQQTEYQLLDEYFNGKSIPYTITIIKDYNDLKNEEDHFDYEEAVLRWYLHHSRLKMPYVSIVGGMKSMSAAFQKVAHWLGAQNVFHTIVQGRPITEDEIKKAIETNSVLKLDMGSEPGWPALRIIGSAYAPELSKSELGHNIYYLHLPPKRKFLSSVQSAITGIQKLSTGSEEFKLPFYSLNLLPSQSQSWLNEELNTEQDLQWIRSLPKVDLHCHLGGFATEGALLRKVQDSISRPALLQPHKLMTPPKNWPLPDKPISLVDYMALGDATGSSLLKDPGCLQAHIQLIYAHFIAEGLQYVEVRCSPDNYKSEGRSSWMVLKEIISVFQECMDKGKQEGRYCHVNLIVIATRKSGGDRSSINRHLALAITAIQDMDHLSEKDNCKVVGVDLAGYESEETRAGYFSADFVGVHRCGLAVTAHAGENDDAEGIWQAVFQLNVRRIGHGLRLMDAPDLLRSVSDRGIGIEMCPFANYQIKGFYPMPGKENVHYPLMSYLKNGILVTVNTDNIGISAASINENFILLAKLCPGIKRMDVLQLIRNSIEVAFCSRNMRNHLLSEFDQQIFKACLLTH